MKIIHAISDVYNLTPVFKYDLNYHPLKEAKVLAEISPAASNRHLEGMMKHSLYRDNFLWLGDIQENMHEALYVDHIHHSAKFSRNIAEHISKFICQTHVYQ